MLRNQATGATVWHHPVTLLVDWIRLRRSNKPSTPMAIHTQVTEATKWNNEVVYVPWDSRCVRCNRQTCKTLHFSIFHTLRIDGCDSVFQRRPRLCLRPFVRV
jgi:hypothetical protein